MSDDNTVPEGFKMTEIGLLPVEWDAVKLENVFKLTSGKARPTSLYPVFGGNGIMGYAESFLVDSPTVILGRVGEYCGSIHISKSKSWISDNALFIKEFLKDNIDLTYLGLSLSTLNLNRLKKKSGQPLITQSIVYSQYIPFPPLHEQGKIAAVFSAVQEAKEKTESVVQAARELKESLVTYLFTYGPVPVEEAEHVLLKETEIGLIPQEWEVAQLEEVCSLRKETIKPENAADPIYIGLEHMNSGDLRVNFYGQPSDIRSTKNVFYDGDILYGKLRPYLDKVVVAPGKGICSTDILVFIPLQDKVTRNYLVNFMHTRPFLKYATITMTGINHPRTSWAKLKDFKLPLPPLPIQEKIATILSAIDRKIEAGENKKKALEALFKTLLSNLMTGKIRVNHLEIAVE